MCLELKITRVKTYRNMIGVQLLVMAISSVGYNGLCIVLRQQ